MKRSSRFLALALALTAAIAFVRPVHAQAPAVTFDSPTVNYNNADWSLGFEFQVGNVPIEIVALGFYQQPFEPWRYDHHVGIFDLAQNLLVNAWVTSGSVLDGFFRYEAVTPVTLLANTTYRIAGTTGSDNYTWNPVNFQVNPAISFKNDVFLQSSTLAYPLFSDGGTNGWFGPNFKLRTTNEVPEPGTLALLVGTAAGGALILRRRARR